jgi:hypothetical protein
MIRMKLTSKAALAAAVGGLGLQLPRDAAQPVRDHRWLAQPQAHDEERIVGVHVVVLAQRGEADFGRLRLRELHLRPLIG